MSWRRVLKSVQTVVAHSLLFTFTLLLVLKLDHVVSYSWWIVFFSIWTFHAAVARGRFSLPAPSVLHNRHWAPCHAIVATPLLVAFELLLCTYLESIYAQGLPTVNLKIVFLPLLGFEIIILVDNFRMCRSLMPAEEESMNDEAIWEALPHFWVASSMVFFIAATVFTILKLCGYVGALGWWDLFINFGIWIIILVMNVNILSTALQNALLFCGSVVAPGEDQNQDRLCSLSDIGGHIMKVPIIGFQILLCMRLEGTPAGARDIPVPVLFSPLFLLQGAGVLFATTRLIEKIVLLLQSGAGTGIFFRFSARACDCFGFLHHGSRLLGWWSIDEGSREEQARLVHESASGYDTFCGYPPEMVKKMPKKDLAEEVWRLQAALGELTEKSKYSKQEFERLRSEEVLCRICFEADISVVLLPCRHHILCSTCCDKCKKCPICCATIEKRLTVYDV